MSTITYRGVKYDAEGYKAKVLQERDQRNNHDLMYRGVKVERKFASQSWVILERSWHLSFFILCYTYGKRQTKDYYLRPRDAA